MMRTGGIPESHTVDGAVLVMAMAMTMAKLRRTCRAARNGPGRPRQ
jgi:hypothetical protein